MASKHRLVVAALALGSASALVVGFHLSSAGAGGGDADAATDARLPSVQQRLDGRYDADGCLRTGTDERDCSVTAQELDDIVAGDDVDDVRQLTGFMGTGWTDDVSAGRPVVLDDSIHVSTDDGLRLVGLVRNETAGPLRSIEVTATVRDAAGTVVATLFGPAAVGGVRSGEPVPFSLTLPTGAVDVADIEWSAEPVDGPDVRRDFEWQPYWERPAGTREPVDIPYYSEIGTGPHPLVLFGSVMNLGPDGGAAQVTTAWFDADGALVTLVTTDVVDPTGTVVGLDGGQAGDALLVAPGVPDGSTSTTWVSGS